MPFLKIKQGQRFKVKDLPGFLFERRGIRGFVVDAPTNNRKNTEFWLDPKMEVKPTS